MSLEAEHVKSSPHNTANALYPELSFVSVILHCAIALNDRAIFIISLGTIFLLPRGEI